MQSRSAGRRKFSFDLLAGDTSGDDSHPHPTAFENGALDTPAVRRKRKSRKRKTPAAIAVPELGAVRENGHYEPAVQRSAVNGEVTGADSVRGVVFDRTVIETESECSTVKGLRQRKLNGTVAEELVGGNFEVLVSRSVVETVCESTVVVPELQGSELRRQRKLNSVIRDESSLEDVQFEVQESRSAVETLCENAVVEAGCESSCLTNELRQREVNFAGCSGNGERCSAAESNVGRWMPESNEGITRLETVESLDWKKVLADNPNLLGDASPVYRSPLKYFMGEIYGGSSLRSTISAGNDKKRQRVYNTVFHVPVRCERLIVAGFFVCVDSFLSLLTIMPARIAMTIWRILKTRRFQRPNAAELSDFGCFVVLASGVICLQLTDISLIYHIIRGQGLLKLYVVYNVLEIFDKLCQSFGEDVLQVLFNSAEGLATCSSDSIMFEVMRFIFDQAIAVTAFLIHSFVLLAQAITLSTCIIAHNNALLALLVSNNFAEIKSNVFKRVSKENLHNLVYYDIVERFHITAFVLFVLAQNILETEGPWFRNFLTNAFLVYMCEIFIDMIKHSFLAKFNDIKPIAYSEFLEDLCRQVLNEKPEDRGTDLTFIPLAPACVVIRVLTPIYASLLPIGPLPWRLTWIVIWCTLTYIMIAACKIMVGLGLQRLATWYIGQCLKRKQHND